MLQLVVLAVEFSWFIQFCLLACLVTCRSFKLFHHIDASTFPSLWRFKAWWLDCVILPFRWLVSVTDRVKRNVQAWDVSYCIILEAVLWGIGYRKFHPPVMPGYCVVQYCLLSCVVLCRTGWGETYEPATPWHLQCGPPRLHRYWRRPALQTSGQWQPWGKNVQLFPYKKKKK